MKKIAILAILISLVSFSSVASPAMIYNKAYAPHTVHTFDPALEQFQVRIIVNPSGTGNCITALALYTAVWGDQYTIYPYGSFNVTYSWGFRGNVTPHLTNVPLPYLEPGYMGDGFYYYNACALSIPGGTTYVSNTPFVLQGTDD
jgi:hypothetical protein